MHEGLSIYCATSSKRRLADDDGNSSETAEMKNSGNIKAMRKLQMDTIFPIKKRGETCARLPLFLTLSMGDEGSPAATAAFYLSAAA